MIWDWLASNIEPYLRRNLYLDQRLAHLEHRVSKNSDALAELDAQIDALEEYVLSDDETDANEVQSRVARLKSVLAEVQPAPQPAPEPAPEPEPGPTV